MIQIAGAEPPVTESSYVRALEPLRNVVPGMLEGVTEDEKEGL